MKVVLAYSGNTLPNHHMANLSMLERTFPDLDIITVVDSPSAHLQLVDVGQKSFLVHEIERFNRVKARLSHDPKFWNGFWFLTIKRFFLLQQFIQETKSSDVLHLESDVVLMPDFPFDKLVSLDCELAFPLVDDHHAAASVMFIKDITAINKLIDYIDSDRISHDDTDMTLLAKYANETFSVFILPSTIQSNSVELNSNTFFEGVFDGATYGQFLFGLDPRNNMGMRTLFKPLLDHHAQAHKYIYQVILNDKGYSLRMMNKKVSAYPIYNLHIHSKDLRVFELDSKNPELLIQRCEQAALGRIKVEFILIVFLKHFPAILKYLPHLIKKQLKERLGPL